jgi:D-glycero-beta-D-manno-heptose-7-phosphate kinase
MFSTAEQIRNVFNEFEKLKVLIVGDVMIDSYLKGKVERISPEAPVPVVSLQHRDDMLGGAANVALNIKALGAEAILCSVIGDDQQGVAFLKLLEREGIGKQGILTTSARITTTKSRIIGNKMQMLRVDHETDLDISKEEEKRLMECIHSQVINRKPDVVILQDYNKGVLTPFIIEGIIQLAASMKIPVVADPKRKNFTAYHSIQLFKPNLKEIREGLKIDIDSKSEKSLCSAAEQIHTLQKVQTVMITLSEDGVFVSHQQHHTFTSAILKAHLRNISDVSGAGDTVISVAALCTACGLGVESMAGLSNLAGGLVCEQAGVVPIDKLALQKEAISILVPKQ